MQYSDRWKTDVVEEWRGATTLEGEPGMNRVEAALKALWGQEVGVWEDVYHLTPEEARAGRLRWPAPGFARLFSFVGVRLLVDDDAGLDASDVDTAAMAQGWAAAEGDAPPGMPVLWHFESRMPYRPGGCGEPKVVCVVEGIGPSTWAVDRVARGLAQKYAGYSCGRTEEAWRLAMTLNDIGGLARCISPGEVPGHAVPPEASVVEWQDARLYLVATAETLEARYASLGWVGPHEARTDTSVALATTWRELSFGSERLQEWLLRAREAYRKHVKRCRYCGGTQEPGRVMPSGVRPDEAMCHSCATLFEGIMF